MLSAGHYKGRVGDYSYETGLSGLGCGPCQQRQLGNVVLRLGQAPQPPRQSGGSKILLGALFGAALGFML
jgi:hypothetical protein